MPDDRESGRANGIFQMRVIMDDGGDTSFFFDNLSFLVNVCP